jgi:hypothetical protein
MIVQHPVSLPVIIIHPLGIKIVILDSGDAFHPLAHGYPVTGGPGIEKQLLETVSLQVFRQIKPGQLAKRRVDVHVFHDLV